MAKKRGAFVKVVLVLGLCLLTSLLLLLTIVYGGKVAITGAAVGAAVDAAEAADSLLTTESSTIWKSLFNDSFNRNDSSVIGNGWTEITDEEEEEEEENDEEEEDEDEEENDEDDEEDSFGEDNSNLSDNGIDSQSEADVKIQNQHLKFDSKNKKNRPIAIRRFQAGDYGQLNFSLVFNFERSGNDKDYEFWMQLGNNAIMVDPKINPNQGVAVNLKWGGTKNGFANHGGFGQVLSNNTFQLATINNPNTTIEVLISLENRTFNVVVNGTIVGTNLVFDNNLTSGSNSFNNNNSANNNNNITIDTVRFYTNKLRQKDFKWREIDDVSIKHTESKAPKLFILTPPLSRNLSQNESLLFSSGRNYNVSSVMEISANVTDESQINEVKAVIDYPNGTSKIVTLNLADNVSSSDNNNNNNNNLKYNASFIVPNLQGKYKINFIALDEYQNINSTEIRLFLVNSTDADNDGTPDEIDTLLGDWRNVTASGISSFNATIGGQDAQGTFNGVKEINFYDGTEILVNFTNNFSAHPLDFSKISIRTSEDSIIVNLSNQLANGELKTVYLKDNNFANLCVKDSELSSSSEISADCTGINETDFTSCLGNSTGFIANNIVCYDEGSTIKITNLQHSGVKGIIRAVESPRGNGGDDSSSSNRNSNLNTNNLADAPVVSETPAETSQNREPASPSVEENSLILTSENGLENNNLPTGAVISQFPEKSLTPYVLDAVMLVSIMIIILVVVWFSKNSVKRSKKE